MFNVGEQCTSVGAKDRPKSLRVMLLASKGDSREGGITVCLPIPAQTTARGLDPVVGGLAFGVMGSPGESDGWCA